MSDAWTDEGGFKGASGLTRLRRPISGRSGFLRPQHFQLRDAYLEDLLGLRLALAAPFAWGLAELAVDREAIGVGVVRIRSLLGRFPSGTLAFHSPADDVLEARLPASLEEGGFVDVWLAVADACDDAPNVSASGSTTRHRHDAEDDDVPALQPQLQLVWGMSAELPNERMRVARVRYGNGGFTFVPDALAPMLRVYEDSFLPRAVRALVTTLLERRSELLELRADRPFDPRSFPASEAEAVFFLSAANQALAVLENANDARELAPEVLHSVLTELLGALESLDSRSFPAIPRYQHDAPGPGFRALCDRLLALVSTVARVPHHSFPLERIDPATFSLRIADPSILQRRVYLVVTGADGRWLEADIPTLAKLASDALLPRTMNTAVRGAALAPEFDPPASFPNNPESACFRVDTRSEYWADILERKQLKMHFAGAPPGLSIALYVASGSS